jgi:SRSO17 transposase
MLKRAFAAGVPYAWVTGDSAYGADYTLRRLIEQHGRGYVMRLCHYDDQCPAARPQAGDRLAGAVPAKA